MGKKIKRKPSTIIFRCEDYIANAIQDLASTRGVKKSVIIRELILKQLSV